MGWHKLSKETFIERFLTEWEGGIFEHISHRIAGIPSDFHGSLNQNGGNQGLDRFLNDFSKPRLFYMTRLQKIKQISKGTDCAAFNLEKQTPQ